MLRRHAGEQPSHVLVLATLGAPQRRLLRRRRARRVAPEPPATPVSVTRVTIVDTQALDGEVEARRWLESADHAALADEAIARLNRVLHAHRIATADPGPRDVTRREALVARIGFGAGEEVAEGRHTAALALPPVDPGRGRRLASLRPQERLAALLGGRDAALACEELALRARADMRAGRSREAALTLRVALEAALSELAPWSDHGDLAERLTELRADREAVAAAANRALDGGLDPAEEASVDRVLGRLEAALRARTAGGFA